MIESTLLFSILLPLGLAGLWWLGRHVTSRRCSGDFLLVPVLAILVGHGGLLGVPGSPANNALSGFVYTVSILLVYCLTSTRVSVLRTNRTVRAGVFLLLFVVIYYPRLLVVDQLMAAVSRAAGLPVLGLLGWELFDYRQGAGGESTTVVLLGLYCLQLSLVVGVYTSFLAAQLFLSVAVGLLGLALFDFLGAGGGFNGAIFTFVPGFTVIVLLYVLGYTTLPWYSVYAFGLGGVTPALPVLPLFRDHFWSGVLIAVVVMTLFVGIGGLLKEYEVFTVEPPGTYRPYR